MKAFALIFPLPIRLFVLIFLSHLLSPALLFSQNGQDSLIQILPPENNTPLAGALVFGVKNGDIGTSHIASSDSFGYVVKKELMAFDSIAIQTDLYGLCIFTNWKSQKILRLYYSDFSVDHDIVILAVIGLRAEKQTSAFIKISREALQRDGGLTIRNAINRLPGVYMHGGALNTNRITIRGIGSRTPFATNKVRVFWNDIPLSSGEGETTIEDLDVSQFNTVEVVRGPASSQYGAGLGGVICLHSPHYLKGLQIGTKLTAGSYGRKQSGTSVNIGDTNQHWAFAYNRLASDGFRENNTYNRQAGTLIGDIYRHRSPEKPSSSQLSLLLNFTHLHAFIPSSLDSSTYVDHPSRAAANWGGVRGFEQYNKALWGLSYQHSFSHKWTGNATVFSQFKDGYELRPFGILKETDLTTGVRGNLRWRPSFAFQVMFLGEFFHEWYNWQTFSQTDREISTLQSNQQEKRSFYNLAGKIIYNYTNTSNNKCWLELDLNLNRTRYSLADYFSQDSIDQTGNYQFSPILSPRIAWYDEIGNHTTLRALISHGFSPPSVSETLTPDGLVNPDIQPEQGWNFEVGSRGLFWKGRIQTDLTLFYMAIQDLLVARRTGQDAYIGINAGATRHQGIEASYLVNLSPKSGKIALKTHGSLTLADYRFQDFVDDGKDFSGNKLPGTPSQQISAGIDIGISPRPIGTFELNLSYDRVGTMYLQDANTIQSSPYNLAHTKLSYQNSFKTGKLMLDVQVDGGLRNIFDVHYASMIQINASSFGGRAPRYYYPGMPRNWFGGIGVKVRL